jgi:hypothetical protein
MHMPLHRRGLGRSVNKSLRRRDAFEQSFQRDFRQLSLSLPPIKKWVGGPHHASQSCSSSDHDRCRELDRYFAGAIAATGQGLSRPRHRRDVGHRTKRHGCRLARSALRRIAQTTDAAFVIPRSLLTKRHRISVEHEKTSAPSSLATVATAPVVLAIGLDAGVRFG